MPQPSLLRDLAPLLWLALAALLTGFASYLVVGDRSHAVAREAPAYATAQASAPASDAWNLPKRI